MGKRSSFERIPRDFYQTPEAAVPPLLPFLREILTSPSRAVMMAR
jgi:hypothetical protein